MAIHWITRIQQGSNLFLDQAIRKLNHSIVRLDGAAGTGINKFTVRSLIQLRRYGLALRKGIYYKITLLTGVTSGGSSPCRVAYISQGKTMDFIETILFQEGTIRQTRVGKCPVWSIPRVANQLSDQVDLLIIEGDQNWIPDRGDWLVAPLWVRMIFRFRPDETRESLMMRLSRQEKNIRKVHKAGFSFKISRDPADFKFFYDRMYVPLIHSRHGKSGIIEDISALNWFFNQGFILFVLDSNGQAVAGDLCMVQNGTFWSRATGVLDGDFAYIDQGAQSALYYYSFLLCIERGIKAWDVGLSRPFAKDGNYQYKHRWDFEAEIDPWQTRRLVFWIPQESQAAIDWLAEHPFIQGFNSFNGRHLDRIYASPVKEGGI